MDVEFENVGLLAASNVGIEVRVDGNPVATPWTVNQLINPGETIPAENFSIGRLSPGTHRVDVFVDPPQWGGNIRELDEFNNITLGTPFVVGIVDPPPPPDLAPALWGDASSPIGISASADAHSDQFPILSSDEHVYVDIGVGDVGAGPARPFSIEVNLDGRVVGTLRREVPLQVEELAVEFLDLDLGALAAGSHTVEITIDPADEVAETDETNNKFRERSTFCNRRPSRAGNGTTVIETEHTTRERKAWQVGRSTLTRMQMGSSTLASPQTSRVLTIPIPTKTRRGRLSLRG